MPAPEHVPPLPLDPMLPLVFRILADATLRHPRATADHVLVLADACDEAIDQADLDHLQVAAVQDLASELRLRSGEYA